METKFKPLDLSKGIVNVIFKNCIEDRPDQTSAVAFFHLKRYGYAEDSPPVFFNSDALNANKPLLYYILGQLQNVHDMKQPILQPADFFKKYTGENWTDDSVAVMKLIHLAIAAEAVTQFSATEDITGVLTNRVRPTLSPKDPNFEAWYAEYQTK